MSKFKVGCEVEIITDDLSFTSAGEKAVIQELEQYPGGLAARIQNEKFGIHWVYVNKLKPISKSKPHTETDRRKAAKAVRELEKKLNAALKKATDTGIKIGFPPQDKYEIHVDMTYQPETPKMRRY